MCFAIPYQVTETDGEMVIIEGGKRVAIDKELRPKRGDYIQLAGKIAVGVLSRREGKKIRQLIQSLNT